MSSSSRAVVTDASPLIALSRIGRVDLLGQLFPQVFLPPAVGREVGPHLAALPFLRPLAPTSIDARVLVARLGAGETEAIALGLEQPVRFVLLDDDSARRLAQILGVPVIGTVGMLIQAKRQGLVSHVRPDLDALVRDRFRISRAVYQDVLNRVGERP